MKTLLDEAYAPVTSQIGYLEADPDRVVGEFARWSEEIGQPTAVSDIADDDFPYSLHRLEPLSSGPPPRTLFVEVGSWTAYFDCGLTGTDPIVTVGEMAKRLACRGLSIATVPHTIGRDRDRPGRYGARKWELFAPRPTEIMNYERTIALVHDGSRWIFETWGQPQPYEDVARYQARRAEDRFDSEMIEAYSRAIGVDVFNASAYGPRISLAQKEWNLKVIPETMSLWNVQEMMGIHPGRAATLPG